MTVIGCDKDDENTETNVDGNYIGVFERAGNTSDVELSINNGTWTGESETEKFPDLCNGHYSISGNIITFENACPWTAEFDWSLILSDDWNYPYSRETAVTPLDWVAASKYWPTVARVDNAYGDRNLICSCNPIEDYIKEPA